MCGMADDVASTLKTGFIVVGLLLAGILYVLLSNGDGNSADRTPDQTRNPSKVGKNWTNALEARCRDLKSRFDAMDDEFAQLEREYNQGRYTEAEGSALQGQLSDKKARLEDELYRSCVRNRELWKYLHSTW